MITTTFSKQFKKDFHQKLLQHYTQRMQAIEQSDNMTERKIVCDALQYHERQLNILTNTATHKVAV